MRLNRLSTRVSLVTIDRVVVGFEMLGSYLEEADVIGVLLEASTAHHQTILSNQTVMI